MLHPVLTSDKKKKLQTVYYTDYSAQIVNCIHQSNVCFSLNDLQQRFVVCQYSVCFESAQQGKRSKLYKTRELKVQRNSCPDDGWGPGALER